MLSFDLKTRSFRFLGRLFQITERPNLTLHNMNIEEAIKLYDNLYGLFHGEEVPKAFTGQASEMILRELVRTHINRSFDVGHGFVVDKSGRRSGQLDVIVFQKGSASFQVGDLVVVDPSKVVAIVQVKSWQTTSDIESVAANLKSARDVAPNAATYAFFWTFNSFKQFKNVDDLAKDHGITGIFGVYEKPKSSDVNVGSFGMKEFLNELNSCTRNSEQRTVWTQ